MGRPRMLPDDQMMVAHRVYLRPAEDLALRAEIVRRRAAGESERASYSAVVRDLIREHLTAPHREG